MSLNVFLILLVTYAERSTHKNLHCKSKAMVQLSSETENSKIKQTMIFSGGNLWLSLAGYTVFDKKD